MPSYDYRCRKCNETFTLSMSMGEHDNVGISLREHRSVAMSTGEQVRCPKCLGDDLEPVLAAFYAKTSRKS